MVTNCNRVKVLQIAGGYQEVVEDLVGEIVGEI
jgi:hypothetical protein